MELQVVNSLNLMPTQIENNKAINIIGIIQIHVLCF